MINTADAPSQRSAEPTAPFAPKAREIPDRLAKAICQPATESVRLTEVDADGGGGVTLILQCCRQRIEV